MSRKDAVRRNIFKLLETDKKSDKNHPLKFSAVKIKNTAKSLLLSLLFVFTVSKKNAKSSKTKTEITPMIFINCITEV